MANSQEKYYLHIGRWSDLKDPKERTLYRLFEILPGAFTFGVFALAVLLSWLTPAWVSLFILIFILYWFARLVYFGFHLKASYSQMRSNEKTDWLEKLNELSPSQYQAPVSSWHDLYHLVIVPTYQEPLEILRATLSSLRYSDYSKERMIVVLGMEERAGKEGRQTAELLEKEFKDMFFKFLVTAHPDNLPNETAGKASNETWATKKAKEEIIDLLGIPYSRVILTSLDSDSVVFPKYFSCLAYYFLTTPKPLRTSFQPIPLFFNNLMEAPAISRVFSFNSTFWHMMNQSRPEKLITFSTHSMSFQAVVDVGFKQTNVVSDDSRIFWQCYLKYDGDYKTQPVYYPISMDANAALSFWQTLKNIYKQQRRWAYGVADVPYFLFGFLKNKKIPFWKKVSPAWEVFFGFWSWASVSIMIFLLSWLPLWLGGESFSQSLISYNLPRLTSGMLRVGMLGLLGSIYLMFLLFPINFSVHGRRKIIFFVLQWALLPVVMVFSSIPALEAQIRLMAQRYLGFWVTPKFRQKSQNTKQ
ncbi:MAG: glycosyltransferase family 2 protein [Candidatus Wildermuthbacteria bacterium]|nr:glycosyltransferase family 2 protein [Candidatus Wildermuthbacteria bacterium]